MNGGCHQNTLGFVWSWSKNDLWRVDMEVMDGVDVGSGVNA